MATLALPPKVNVPATPAIEGVSVQTLYDVANGQLLGKGGFSEVLAVRYIPTGEIRALKIMDRSILTGKKGEMVAHEKEILRRACHPNIVTLYETLQTRDKVYFALDAMNEDLFEFIVRNRRINETIARQIMFSLMSGIAYLHEQSVVHRDIKPENILINTFYKGTEAEEGSQTGLPEGVKSINDVDPSLVDVEIKIADFGLAKVVMEWDVRSTPCGTSFYIAPEIIRGIEEQGARPMCTTQKLVKSVDVWSAGVVFFVLLSGRPPFHGQVKTGDERRALLHKIDRGVLFNPQHGWDGVSEEAKDLILHMLDQDVSDRYSAAQVLQHPFFTAHGFTKPTPGSDPVLRQKQIAESYRLLQQQQQHIAGTTVSSTVAASATESGKAETGEHRHNHSQEKDANGDYQGHGNGSIERPHKKRNFFKTLFGGEATSKKDTKEGKEAKELQDELDALQKEVVDEEDKEGDTTAYKPAMPVLPTRPTKPAVMNARAKVGPAALKK